MEKYDFSGWATRNDLRCSDGRTIMRDAFKENDGHTVPIVWNHRHDTADNVLGHALLENKPEGVYAYGKFNDTEQGRNAKLLVESGDITALSIFANGLRQQGGNVLHGDIKEVSLVLAGANPGAFIETLAIEHGEMSDEDAVIYTGEEITLCHGCDNKNEEDSMEKPNDEPEKKTDEQPKSKGNDEPEEGEETIEDIFNTFTEKQKTAAYAMVTAALKAGKDTEETNKKEGENMSHNLFENEEKQGNVLTHADGEAIVKLAKSNGVGSLQAAIGIFSEENETLAHGIDGIESLFPDYKDVKSGAPELLTTDQGWISAVMNKTHKSPIARIRTRQADIRDKNLRAYGYIKGKKKKVTPNFKLLNRTTDPQTVYRKDALNRDDIIDIVDFDVVEYQYGIMKLNLNEEIAMAIMIGDGREDGDQDKIEESHIRSIWHDDELYCIHTDVDIEAAKTELNGTETGASFGENYIYAEAIISSALYAREQYKGSGNLDFYCTPHLLNVMLLARDLNGRRIYNSKTDLTAALNVNNIYTCEQFEGKTRTTSDSKTKKLLGIFVNLADYQIGSTKGGEITRFNQFDIDFNQEKYLIETRISGALTRAFSAIALEEDITEPSST